MPRIPVIMTLLVCAATAADAANTTPTYQVRLVVSVVNSDKPADEIYVVGTMNDWQPGTTALPHVGNGVYVKTLSLTTTDPVEYKFTRGKSWTTVEKGTYGDEINNRVVTLSRAPGEVVIYNHVSHWADEIKYNSTQTLFSLPESLEALRPSTRTGNIKAIGPLPAPQLGDMRQVLVYLPPGYEESNERYPVLYMLDGQNVFDESTAYIGVEMGLDEAAEKGVPTGELRPCIIVAIYNSGARVSEYTPIAHPRRGGGEADKFLDFVVETVKPYIDKNFRSKPDREYTTFAGASLGGLCTIYAAMRHHDVFQSFGVLAPSLQWSSYQIMPKFRAADLPSDLRFWIEVGEGRDPLISTAETEPDGQPKVSKYTSACRELGEILKSKGIKADNLHYKEHASEFHDEHEWGERAKHMLNFLVK